MAKLTAFYFDFQSKACYLVWRWLRLLDIADQVELRPFSLDAQVDGPWDSASSWGLDLLALGEVAREDGAQAHAAYAEAAFAAVHGPNAQPRSAEAWLALGAVAGVDLEAFTADADRWRAEVGLWHREAVDELGVSTLPSIVFGPDQAFQLRLRKPVADAEAARRLLTGLSELCEQQIIVVRRMEPPE